MNFNKSFSYVTNTKGGENETKVAELRIVVGPPHT